jgi:cytochrome c oxidase subunit 2
MTEDTAAPPPAPHAHLTVHTYEKAFLAVGIAVLVLCAAALVYATFGMGIHLPGRVAKVDPATLTTTPPFNHPGVFHTGPGRDSVVVVARTWFYDPATIQVPVGDTVTFVVTSGDAIHGFFIAETRVNMMAIPGQVSRNSYVFRRKGEYLLVCHEYCGVGHQTMAGKVVVQ